MLGTFTKIVKTLLYIYKAHIHFWLFHVRWFMLFMSCHIKIVGLGGGGEKLTKQYFVSYFYYFFFVLLPSIMCLGIRVDFYMYTYVARGYYQTDYTHVAGSQQNTKAITLQYLFCTFYIHYTCVCVYDCWYILWYSSS